METRPHGRRCYAAEDAEETAIQCNDGVIELWTRVIEQAINDAAYYRSMRRRGETLTSNEQEIEESAWAFLFAPDYYIAMDEPCVDLAGFQCQALDEVTSEELLQVLGITDLERFRNRCRLRINEQSNFTNLQPMWQSENCRWGAKEKTNAENR